MRILRILAGGDEAMKQSSIPTSDRGFFLWLHRHVYWYQLIQCTLELYVKIESSNEKYKQMHNTVVEFGARSLENTLKAWREEHFEKAFWDWKGAMRATLDAQTQPHLLCTSRRLFYRYLLCGYSISFFPLSFMC